MTDSALVSGYALRLGDDALIASQRLIWWCSRAPDLEEDVALANITLDLLGQARTLLSHAAEMEGVGRDEDSLAYLRTAREFHNLLLVELPDRDFATCIARLYFFALYQNLCYSELTGSTDPTLAGLAGKAVKETRYHVEYAGGWVVRLGDGTAESHRRMQAAVDELWPYTREMFLADEVIRAAAQAGVGVDPEPLREPWLAAARQVLTEATLTEPDDGWTPTGGREGRHTEAFEGLLAEMQSLHRQHVGARW